MLAEAIKATVCSLCTATQSSAQFRKEGLRKRDLGQHVPPFPCPCAEFLALLPRLIQQLDNPELSADVLRMEPLGLDVKGNRFYYLGQDHDDCW